MLPDEHPDDITTKTTLLTSVSPHEIVTSTSLDLFSRVSVLNKLIRIVNTMLKWKNIIRPKSVPITRKHAIKCLVRVVQHQCYTDDIFVV